MMGPDREKMMARINNLNVTLESLYRLAWQDGYAAALERLERMANTDLINPPMTASDDDLNKGIQMVMYDIYALRRMQEGVKNYEV